MSVKAIKDRQNGYLLVMIFFLIKGYFISTTQQAKAVHFALQHYNY